jgi:hypothetical protein
MKLKIFDSLSLVLSLLNLFSGVRVTQSLVLCVFFIDRCFSFCPFSLSTCLNQSIITYMSHLLTFCHKGIRHVLSRDTRALYDIE